LSGMAFSMYHVPVEIWTSIKEVPSLTIILMFHKLAIKYSATEGEVG